MAKIKSISKLAKKQGFKISDEIKQMGGYKFVDELDFLYFDNEKKFDVLISRDGKDKLIHVSKKEGESLGLEFEEEMSPYVCKNHCIFCFVDQLPKGLRDTLYVKDDDYRFSFLCGSYVTMTNVSDEEIDRIIRLKLSPLYISVHAYDNEVRKYILKNPHTEKLIDMMRKLGQNGIKMHTQLVICPGINDGKVLKESIEGLHSVEGVETVAVVPVGLTVHRDKLDALKPVDEQNAKETIKLVEELNEKYKGFCYCSDEYYVKAKLDVKDYQYYGDFEQIENGVGLIADFMDNYKYSLDEVEDCNLQKEIGFITGSDFAPILEKVFPDLEKKLNIKATVYGIKNKFFGESVTVAGLVTATDIIEQVKDKKDAFIIPNNMLREFSDAFLDSKKLSDLSKALGGDIIVVPHNGTNMARAIIDHFKK